MGSRRPGKNEIPLARLNADGRGTPRVVVRREKGKCRGLYTQRG